MITPSRQRDENSGQDRRLLGRLGGGLVLRLLTALLLGGAGVRVRVRDRVRVRLRLRLRVRLRVRASVRVRGQA